MAKLSITLRIAGASYPFPDIDSSQEEIYRHAEREVNRLFVGNAHPSLLPKDQLALAALQLAMENAELRASRSLGEDIERLAEIDRQLGDYMHSADKGMQNETQVL